MPSSLQQKYDDLQFAHGQRGAVATGDALTIQLGELLLSHGVEIRASDIHIEPTASGARIRYRTSAGSAALVVSDDLRRRAGDSHLGSFDAIAPVGGTGVPRLDIQALLADHPTT